MSKVIKYLLGAVVGALLAGSTAFAAGAAVTEVDMVLYTNENTMICSEADMGKVILTSCDKALPVKVTGITGNGFYRCDLGQTVYIPGNGLTQMNSVKGSGKTSAQNKSNGGKYKASDVCYIFLGDSRTVLMSKALGNLKPENVHFICKTSMGYPWLSSDAWVELNSFIASTNYEHYIVITNLGVNGLYNKPKYMDFYLRYMENMENVTMYYISVNPVDEVKFPKISNATIVDFNNDLQAYFGDRYINTYDYILANMVTKDGLHYGTENNIWVYSTALNRVMNDVATGVVHK